MLTWGLILLIAVTAGDISVQNLCVLDMNLMFIRFKTSQGGDPEWPETFLEEEVMLGPILTPV